MVGDRTEYYLRRLRRYKNLLRNLWLRHSFARLALSVHVSPEAKIYGSRGIFIDSGVIIHHYAILQCTKMASENIVSETIQLGEDSQIQPFAYLQTDGAKIKIGKNCSVNAYAVLYGGLSIGNFVRIAAHTVIIPSNHNFDRTDIPICKQGTSSQGITIDDDVWIGAGVKILDGVHVATGCVIGAGSVLNASTEPYGIYVGAPARLIKFRNETSKK
jgi:acetyltransferase-like isoleucine patch superfamily enzyme